MKRTTTHPLWQLNGLLSEPFSAGSNNLSDDEKSQQMADFTLALFESMGVEPPANPTVETIKALMKLMDESYMTNVLNN